MEKERAVAMWRLVPSFNVGFDSEGGGAGSPHCSEPPLKPKPAAISGTNKKRIKKGKEEKSAS